MIGSEFLLTALAGHLAAVGLGHYNVDGHYLDHPDLPAVLFADADVPDTALVLTVTGVDPALGDWDIEFAYRATGVTPGPVETIADNVFDHFHAILGVHVATIDTGTAVVLPSVTLPGGFEWTNVDRTARGTAELTSPAKHKGSRFVRSDTYRLTVHDA